MELLILHQGVLQRILFLLEACPLCSTVLTKS